jgi:7-carboxy-7-deazaguanine synthase
VVKKEDIGQHRRVSAAAVKLEQLRIQERFVSVQGEGTLVGVPSSFVRVSGCNLRCVWCDTPKSSWAPEGEREQVAALVEWCVRGPRHVVVTGGEPLLFPATASLCRDLRARGRHVTVETAGTVWCEQLEVDLISISPKLAHSTPWARAKPKLAERHERARLDLAVLRRLIESFDWQLKFVVRTTDAAVLEADLAEIEALLEALSIPTDRRERVLLMPEGTDADSLRAGYRRLVEPCMRTGMRVGLRLHIELFGHTPGT